jgi:hypothetical protein
MATTQFVARNGLIALSDSTVSGSLFVSQSVTATSFTGAFSGSVFGYVPNEATTSFVTNSQTSSFVTNSQTGSFATTDSNIFIGNQTVTGSLFTSGSNTLIGTTTLTGSFNVSGSTTQTGNNTLFGNTLLTGSIIISGSYGLTGSLFVIGQNSNIVSQDSYKTNDFFLIRNSTTTLKVNSGVEVSSSVEVPFKISTNAGDNILFVSQSGIVVFATSSVVPEGAAPNGAFLFTSGALYIGID